MTTITTTETLNLYFDEAKNEWVLSENGELERFPTFTALHNYLLEFGCYSNPHARLFGLMEHKIREAIG